MIYSRDIFNRGMFVFRKNSKGLWEVMDDWHARAQTAVDSGRAAGVSWRMKNGEGSELEGIMGHQVLPLGSF